MKKKLYSLALAGAVLGAVSASAFASDGTITINGSITDATCTVKGDGANGDLLVNLDKISAKGLAKAGDTGGFKPFSIKLTDCAATGEVKAGFDPGPTTDLANGRLNLVGTDGVATNLQLQLRNSDSSVIKVGDSASIKGATIANKAATLTYLVGYYATGAATAGTANSSVTYSINYE